MTDQAAIEPVDSGALERHRYLVVVSQLAAISVVMLPALGAAIRCVTFATDDQFGDWIRVGLADPVPTLAGIGLDSLVFPVATFIFFAWYLPIMRKSAAASAASGKKTFLLPKRAVSALIAATILYNALFVSVGTGVLSVLLGLLAGTMAVRIEIAGGLTLAKGVPVLALLILGSLVTGVLAGSSAAISPIDYTFAKSSPLPNGEYIRLGSTSTETFLRPCFGKNESVYVLPSSDVRLERFLSHRIPSPPSLYQVIFENRTFHLGLTFPCQ